MDMGDDRQSVREKILRAMAPCEPYTANDLAESIGEPRRTVDYNLRKMSEEGIIEYKKHSEQRVTWWIEEEEG